MVASASTVVLLTQAILVQTELGEVQSAVMHIAEMDASTEDLRVTAMHLRSPIHSLMFNSRGELLGANSSALKACHMHTPGMVRLLSCHAGSHLGMLPMHVDPVLRHFNSPPQALWLGESVPCAFSAARHSTTTVSSCNACLLNFYTLVCHAGAAVQTFTLKMLFNMGSYPGKHH